MRTLLGGEAFIRRIRELISPNSRQPSVVKARVVTPVTLSQIVTTTCDACDISPEQLQVKGSRHAARYLIALLARQHSGSTLRELAHVLGLERADSVTTLLRSARRAPASAEFRRLAAQIRQRLDLP